MLTDAEEVAETLLKFRADKSLLNKDCCTPLQMASNETQKKYEAMLKNTKLQESLMAVQLQFACHSSLQLLDTLQGKVSRLGPSGCNEIEKKRTHEVTKGDGQPEYISNIEDMPWM